MRKRTSQIQFCPLINSLNWVYTNWNMTCSLTRPKKVTTKLTTNGFTLNQISHQNICNSPTKSKVFLYVKWFHWILNENICNFTTKKNVSLYVKWTYIFQCEHGFFQMPGIVENVGKNNGELHDVGNISPVEQANAKCGTENVCSSGAPALQRASLRALSAFVFLVRFVVLVFFGEGSRGLARRGRRRTTRIRRWCWCWL